MIWACPGVKSVKIICYILLNVSGNLSDLTFVQDKDSSKLSMASRNLAVV